MIGQSLLRPAITGPGQIVCYCPPGVCQAPRGFRGPCRRASDVAAEAEAEYQSWLAVLASSPSIEREVSMAFCPACFVEVTPEQADAQTNAARVLSEFAKTAPGRLPQRVQDAIAFVEGGKREVSGEGGEKEEQQKGGA